MKKKIIIPCLFLMSALCGCSTQTIEDAKEIVETKTYAYRYELETDDMGEAVTKVYEEKPSDTNDKYDVEEVKRPSIIYKDGTVTYINMNEVYNYNNCEWAITDAITTSYRDFGYEILDSDLADGIMNELKKRPIFNNDGYLKDNDEKLFWIKVHIKNLSEKKREINMSSGGLRKDLNGDMYFAMMLSRIDRETCLTGKNQKAFMIEIEPQQEYDMWMVFEGIYNNDDTYYLQASFGNTYTDDRYSGYLVELKFEER